MVMHKNSFSFDNSVGVIVHSNFVYLTDFRGIFMFSIVFFLKNVVISSKGGVKKKTKKSCNIVTTPVHLPTYPYWCTEGNFFNFF